MIAGDDEPGGGSDERGVTDAAEQGVVRPVAGADMAAAVDIVNVVDPADVEGLVNGPASVDPDATIPG